MPESTQRRSLAYEWTCPDFLGLYCASMSGEQLAIPFSKVADTNIVFEQAYIFDVTVVWAKPDGKIEKVTLSQEVTFWDIAIPEFKIDYEESQLLITAEQNSLFYI